MSIQYHENERLFVLHTKSSTYAFDINEEEKTDHLYWGEKIRRIEDIPDFLSLAKRWTIRSLPGDDIQEYRGWGGYSFTEPCLKVRFSDGTRKLFLKYQGYEIKDNVLIVELADQMYPISVKLKYQVYEEFDLIERSAQIVNKGTEPIFIEQAFSADWKLPYRDDYEIVYFTGTWGAEYQIQKREVYPGKLVLETRTGLSGPEAVPFFMIHEKDQAAEHRGGVYFYSLAWSGNWKAVIDKDKANRVSVVGGINNFDFEWELKAGECFDTPVFTAGYTEGGYGQVSRNIHDYERQVVMHPYEKDRIMPVISNVYGTFWSDINEERIMGIIERAKEIGVECLLLDAGWQGEGDIGNIEYRKGMGTWNVNKTRFPNGLKVIADKLHENGMKFGLWMEPEAIHPENELLKEHPEYVLQYKACGPESWASAYVLNFALDEVRDYITDIICRLIEENDVDYFKIDFNRFIPHIGDCKADWVKYVRNMYKCYNDVKERFPELLFENCASGGMRIDLGMLKFSGRINRSDNQDPLDILKLHEGYSYFMLPKLAGGGCHISDMYTKYFNNRVSTMKYQAHVAMAGSLAIGKNLVDMSPEQLNELKEYVDLYKKIRHVVHLGDLYRLVSPREKSYAVFEYVSKDKSEAVLFVLGQSMQFMQVPERLKILGLEEEALYEVENYGVFSGDGLQKIGLQISLTGDMDSEIIYMKRCGSL